MTPELRLPDGGQRAAGRRSPIKLQTRMLGALITGAATICLGLPAGAAAATNPHGLGLKPSPAPVASGPLAQADSLFSAAVLPASVSLTANAMPVGNQGQVGSCAAWSTIYGALGYWENEEHLTGGGLEPMFSYSQVDGGVDDGSSIEGNLDVAQTEGVDTQADYWQGNFDYADQPTAAEKLNAVNWKLSAFADLTINPSTSSTVTQTSIETALAAGDPVVIGIPVYNNFFYVGSSNSGYYSTISGSLAGYHAVVALGYNSQGLVIENSWGTGWGNAGFATLGWSFVNTYVFDAVSVGPLVSTQPQVSAVPTTGGAAHVGVSSTATPGSWSASATYSYQWESAPSASSDWSTISGATGASYTPSSTLLGSQLRVVVTATGTHGSGSAASAATIVAASSGLPTNTVLPTVSGNRTVGSTLTAATGSWNPAPSSYSYQWQRSTGGTGAWTNISGATAASYVLSSADVGSEDRVTVTATDTAGSASANSAATSVITPGVPVDTAAPTVTGTAMQGSVLTAGVGSWSPTPSSYSYQWQRSSGGSTSGWTNITGATAATYTLSIADVGSEERVTVTATDSGGSASANSAATGVVAQGAPVNTVAPTVTGTPMRGSVLTAGPGTWSPTGTSYSYQWQRSAAGGTGAWTNINGATSASYTPAIGDENAALRVIVTATNGSGSKSADSSATASVKSSPPANTALPTVSGSAAVGGTLTATTGSWSGNANSYGYQWERSTNGTTWTNIAPSVTSRYTPVKADAGDYLRVIVLAGNPDGSASASSSKIEVSGSSNDKPSAGKSSAVRPDSKTTGKASKRARKLAAKLTRKRLGRSHR